MSDDTTETDKTVADTPPNVPQPIRQRPTVLFTSGLLLLAFIVALLAVLIIAGGARERINATQTAQPAQTTVTQVVPPLR